MSEAVQLDRVTLRYGDFTAVGGVELTVEPGEFFSILGPSGCGKTTVLRLIAGFLEPTEGAVRIGGHDMRGLGPNRRPTALVFQNLALFPLMPVWENVAFGLEVRGVAKAERRRRAEELLDLVALPNQGGKMVTELSGGQRQRVAIARALAVEPAVLLLDEPLSALDLKLRQHMRAELRAIQKRTGVTFIYITHDQTEALAMSDRVAVMAEGRLQQVDTPERLYSRPATPFVASFVGENNALPGRVLSVAEGLAVVDTPFGPLAGRAPSDLAPGALAVLFIRPQHLRPQPLPEPAAANDHARRPAPVTNHLTVTVDASSFEGAFLTVTGRNDNGPAVTLHVPHGADTPVVQPGARLNAAFASHDAVVLPQGGAGHA